MYYNNNYVHVTLILHMYHFHELYAYHGVAN